MALTIDASFAALVGNSFYRLESLQNLATGMRTDAPENTESSGSRTVPGAFDHVRIHGQAEAAEVQSSTAAPQSEQLTRTDDRATLGRFDELSTRLRNLHSAIGNANMGIAITQEAASAIGDVTDILQQMQQLAEKASSNGTSDIERAELQSNFDDLRGQLDAAVEGATYNGQALLTGQYGAEVRLETDANTVVVGFADARSTNLGSSVDGKLSDIDLTNQQSAEDALAIVNAAMSDTDTINDDIARTAWHFETAISDLQAAVGFVSQGREESIQAILNPPTAPQTYVEGVQQVGEPLRAETTALLADASTLLAQQLQALDDGAQPSDELSVKDTSKATKAELMQPETVEVRSEDDSKASDGKSRSGRLDDLVTGGARTPSTPRFSALAGSVIEGTRADSRPALPDSITATVSRTKRQITTDFGDSLTTQSNLSPAKALSLLG